MILEFKHIAPIFRRDRVRQILRDASVTWQEKRSLLWSTFSVSGNEGAVDRIWHEIGVFSPPYPVRQ